MDNYEEARLHAAYAKYVWAGASNTKKVKTFEQFRAENEGRKRIVKNLRGFIQVRRHYLPGKSNLAELVDQYERERVI